MALPSLARLTSLITVSIFAITLLGCETAPTEPQANYLPKYSRFSLLIEDIGLEVRYKGDLPGRSFDSLDLRQISYNNDDVLNSQLWSYRDSSQSCVYDSTWDTSGSNYNSFYKRIESLQLDKRSDSTVSLSVLISINDGTTYHSGSGSGGSTRTDKYIFSFSSIPSSAFNADTATIMLVGSQINSAVDSVYYEYGLSSPPYAYTSTTFVRLLTQPDSSLIVLKLYK